MTGRQKKILEDDEKRPSTSLPLFYHESEICGIGPQTGMECMPLRPPLGPYHYHVGDQTKSLQELQNEVGALLEFRDLVIETFPDLKNKMASSSSASSTLSPGLQSSLASRRDWEPGIRVRRKLMHKENTEITTSSLIRSRSNSHSGKKEPKSGEGNGSVVQDSGFSTETSSSKETHSSTSGTVTTQIILTTTPNHRVPAVDAAEDELWNLLDVIQKKSSKLREEVEFLQNIEHEENITNSIPPSFLNQLKRLSKDDVKTLRQERDRLLDKLAEMEAETISCRLEASETAIKLDAMSIAKRELEHELKIVLSQKVELNTRINDMHDKFIARKSEPTSPNLTTIAIPPSTKSGSINAGTRTSSFTTVNLQTNATATIPNIVSNSSNRSSFTPVVKNSSSHQFLSPLPSSQQKLIDCSDFIDSKLNLGRLDGVISAPFNQSMKVRIPDSRKIAAILLESNPIELQRHLLTVTFQNQNLQQQLEEATKFKLTLIKKHEKFQDDIEDLRFQLEEKIIELAGTRAQLRILDSKVNVSPEHLQQCTSPSESPHFDSTLRLGSVSTPSMKAMVPLAMDELLHNSSSTESAHDQAERQKCPDTPKRKPSKIPLPGLKASTAPKPPTGRQTSHAMTRSTSGPSSNRSLNKSTSSLFGKSESSLVKKDSPSFIRPESAQSWRKDTSLNGRSSSIPVSSKSSPAKPSFSPVPKPKRDSLTSRVRSNLDSLTRVQQSTQITPPVNQSATTPILNNASKSNMKKELGPSVLNYGGGIRSGKGTMTTNTVSVRRASSISVGGNRAFISNSGGALNGGGNNNNNSNSGSSDSHQNGSEENGKGATDVFTSTTEPPNQYLITEYLTRTRIPPPIFQSPSHFHLVTKPQFSSSYQQSHIDLAYKHPILLLDDPNDIDDDGDERINIVCELDNEIELRYENIEKKKMDNGEEIETSLIIPTQKKNAFESSESIKFDQNNTKNCVSNNIHGHTGDNENDKGCRLIGKVTPNLIKTWEQLNGITTNPRNAKSKERSSPSLLTTNSENSEQQSCVLFYRKPFAFKEIDPSTDNENFQVNKVFHAESSGDFYDSIDERSIVENTYIVDGNIMMGSLMYHESELAGGEGLASCDSVEKKKMWSLDSVHTN